ncbi:nucleotidyltransferase substrate binding protein [Aquiflexum gelatinilyticum]|uniref:nucleotidyltransferase substrate binding protein n=1 Tax=Aquiflexum gelatinilyticum TaxID=2961943 RepID=UPI00216789CE|nr:nucleotidyltransferase substrate binding protein [Aquiflexum gelatinilyticum]MCS4434291.1 nucleotidyltransferase substrate binding protein [Aquiflexum gelatinilyticum]
MKITPPSCEKCFEDYKDALNELHDVVKLYKTAPNEPKNQKRVIRTFELTHELALKTIAEYFKKQGRIQPFSGSRDATVEAFNEELIDDGKGWLEMIIERIKFNPLYTEDFQGEFAENISKTYIKLLENFERKLKNKLD